MEIETLGLHLGARIHGVDLSRAIGESQFAEIHAAFLSHLVLFFPRQVLSPRQLMAFGQLFGELEAPHPLLPAHPEEPQVTVIWNDSDHPPENDVWHTDVTWKRTPPLGSALHAQTLPAAGGDTLWVSMQAVYDALPIEDKIRFANLSAVHSIESFAGGNHDSQDGTKVAETIMKYPPVEHPMIRTHPETGRHCVFVNQGFTTHIAGLDRQHSDEILQSIWGLVERPEFQLRVKWEPDTLGVWDNRCTQHQAAADYYPEFRKMHRVTVVGDEPRYVPD